MPDTKVGREKKGQNKRAQLEARLHRRELQAMNTEEEPPWIDETDDLDADFLAEELPGDGD
ncbi:MAG: hypothetical protein ACQETI_06435 [Halobacteriota archaeon]